METLKHKGGIPERQAVAQTEALQESLHQALQGLATKADIRDLKAATKSDIRDLKSDIRDFKTATKSDIRDFRTATKSDIRVLEARMDAHQEQMSGLRHMMVLGISINSGMILMLGLFMKFF